MPKYTLEKEETKQRFVARIVETENAPLTANAVVSLIDKRSMKDVKASKIHANLSDAAKHGFIGKTRFQAEGDSRAYVHYHPVDMVVPGEDIPIPAFEKKGGYTKTPAETKEAIDSFNERFKDAEEHSEETAELNRAFLEEAQLWEERNKPAAVKVAEKVIADIAGLPADGATVSDGHWRSSAFDGFYPKPTAEEVAKWGEDYCPATGVTRIVKVEGGFVEMQNDIVLGFTPSLIGHLAQSLFVEHGEAEKMVLDALNGVNILGRVGLVRELRALVFANNTKE